MKKRILYYVAEFFLWWARLGADHACIEKYRKKHPHLNREQSLLQFNAFNRKVYKVRPIRKNPYRK